MSERTALPRTQSSPSNPAVPETVSQMLSRNIGQMPPSRAQLEEEARARIGSLEREAKALGNEPAAALLFHEIGLLWEEPLKNPRNAAVAYQNAYKLAPKFVPNIRAARRLFADVGNWQMVVQLIDAELAASEEGARAGLLLDKGQVLEHRLSKEEDAIRAYALCLQLAPKDPILLVQLEQVFSEKGDHRSLVEVFRLMAEALSDPALRASYLTSAAILLEDRLQKVEEAATLFREAFALDRSDPLLLAAIKRIATRDGAIEELLAALIAEASLHGDHSAPTFLQISKVYERLGRNDDALAALLAARKVSPNEVLVLSELARIYEAQGKYEELADILLSWSGLVSDESELVAINLRLAALYEEQLQQEQYAITRYQTILGKIPGHAAALAGLGKLYFRHQDWVGLLATYDMEIASSDDVRQKAARMYKAAEVLEQQLGRTDQAITRYNQCLQLVPGYLPAQKALTRLFEKEGRYAELVAMYEQDLLQTQDRDQVIATLSKMAAIYESRLDDAGRAIECMRRILDLASDHLPSIRNLSRLCERTSQWNELLALNETEAALTSDIKQVLSLHHRNAEILDEHLQDRQGATAAFERVLSLSPSYLPALQALGRLYAQESRWEDLIRMYRAEAEISASAEVAAGLIHKVGELHEQRLGDLDQAIASYQEVLTLSPSYFPAVRALARIYRTQEAWENLIEVLRAEAANRTDPMERANALYQAAAIWEDHLNRPEMAVEGYQEVLRTAPGHAPAMLALERLFNSQDNVRESLAILERATQVGEQASKVSAYLRLARIYLDQRNEPAKAAQCLDSLLLLDPKNVTALRLLTRIRANDRARRAELKARAAEAVSDARFQAALRLSVAADHEASGLPAGAEVQRSVLPHLQAALTAQPDASTVAFALERSLKASGQFQPLIELYSHRASRARDTTERAELWLRVGEVAETQLSDLPRANEAFANALREVPNLLPALQGRRRVSLQLGMNPQAREALEAEAAAARDPRGAVEAFIAAGHLARQMNDTAGAATNYKKALERDPLNTVAAGALEELASSQGEKADVANLYELRGDAQLSQKDPSAAATDFLTAARAHLEQGDRKRATSTLDRALSALPTHPECLELKAQLAVEDGLFAEAAATYSQRLQQGGDPARLAELHLKVARLYHDELSELTRAMGHLQSVLSNDPAQEEALERLSAIHVHNSNWDGAAECLEKLVDVCTNPAARGRHHLSLAKVREQGFNDIPGATAHYRSALESNPNDAELLQQLCSLYERSGNLPELVQMLEAQANLQSDPAKAFGLRLRAADLRAGPLAQPDQAIASLRRLTEQQPQDPEPLVRLAELYARDPGTSSMAVETLRALLRLDPTRVESLRTLFRIWEGQKQWDKAFSAAGVLIFLRQANEAETIFYSEHKGRLPQDTQSRLLPTDVDGLIHPAARGPVVEILRAIGDQLSKLVPPALEQLGVDKKADRLKPDHAIHKAIRSVAQVFGVDEFDVYQSRRGMVRVETTEPLSVCVDQDVVRKYNAREQKFLIARAALTLANKSAVLKRLSPGELADLIGNSVRIFHPEFTLLGRRNDDASKQLRKAYSRKALKALEEPASILANQASVDLDTIAEALSAYSEDRAGLLLAGEVASGLSMLLRTDPNFSVITGRGEAVDPVLQSVRQRQDVRELISYALSDDFFRFRQKLGLVVS